MDEMEAWMAEAGLTDSVKDTIRAVANGMSTTNVNLNAAGLQDKGTKALAIALNIRPNNDIRVFLDGNSIGKEGCVALAGALRGHTGLQTLYLGNNSIEKEGCVALAGALLEGIGKDAARAFGVKWPMESNYCLILTNSERRAFDEGQRVQDQDKVQQAQNGNDTAVPRPLSREEIERLQRDMQEEDQQLQRKGGLVDSEEIERLQRIIQEKDQQLQRKEERLRQLEDQAESFFNLNLDPARFTTKKRVRDNKGNPVKGAFGKLYRSTLAGHDVALKEVDDVEERPRLQQLLTEMYSTTTSDGDSKRVLREVAVLASLRHPNIVPFLGLCYDNDHNTLSFVLSWAENGSLYDYTHVHKKNLSDVDKLRILSEVAAAMEFLHAHNVVHRDLKSPNVLLDASLSAKVTDFGLSAFVSEDASTMTHVRGTRFWESPEQLFGHDIRADTDVFSFGCVVWEVWFGVVPWHHGPYSRGGITQASLGIRYSNLEYLPLDAEINGRRLTSALQALLCVCFDASGNRVDFSQLHAALKSQQRAARDQEADDLREQHMLLHGPPDAVWKFPQQLLAAVDATRPHCTTST
ncbi:serine/threonine protein kinase [Salpingoeca rosetta]|uniref:Serine/threonine protein kinase n=1 Tax=Salpingoeca rosetta (strain ATCC 50818 / BSB-021) TaxID=946362 RepID=F2UK66_SALR5|nr:serine/threonine protein kinase [Salpingoeca rosetta]EGD77515.1 serine/threonine protein kinase [Salpingoeca rosetta]|eukprot:XP_004990403.1 serine/threonine protein kinase [Salpingoeca rosetta]